MKEWIPIIKEFSTFFGKKLENVGIEIKGAEVVTIKGKDGRDGVDGKDSKVPGPMGPEGRVGARGPKGDRGEKSTVAGPKGATGERGPQGEPGFDGKDGSPDTGEEIIAKINDDKSDHIIRKDKVEGMDEVEQIARTADANTRSFMNTGSYVYDYDLSSLLDGVTKTFTLPANARVITVLSSSAPTVFRKTTDYTTTATTITFTSEITAGSTLAAGQSVIILYKIL